MSCNDEWHNAEYCIADDRDAECHYTDKRAKSESLCITVLLYQNVALCYNSQAGPISLTDTPQISQTPKSVHKKQKAKYFKT